MKTIFTFFLLSIMLTSNCQLSKQDKLFYEQKTASYKSMSSTGVAFMIVGLIGTVAGISITATGMDNLKSDDYDKMAKGVQQETWGYTVAGAGLTLFITGAILNGVGSRKEKEYQQRLDLGIIYNKEAKGLMLVYKF
jgi:hypothetical protein